ncbi:MAG: hypothetical protein NC033_05335 [Clostridiales bacterium]|nr:hypothetical protein [Clostridiales bacterium]
MKSTVQSETLGEIVYEENFWTGGKKITVNGTPLERVSKKEFKTADGGQALVQGNFFTGAKLVLGDVQTVLIPTIKWYEIVLAVLPFVLIMVWGNSVALCRIVPVIGGAIGGGISGGLSVLGLFFMRSAKPVWLKILIGLAAIGLTFGICCGIGYAVLSALT